MRSKYDTNIDMIANSILDTDTYTFSVQNAILDNFPDAIAEYHFVNRGTHKINRKIYEELKYYINDRFTALSLNNKEYAYLKEKCPYFKSWYLDYLKNYKFDPKEIKMNFDDEKGFELKIVGPWHRTVMWEVPILAAISELYYRHVDKNWSHDGQIELINQKGKILSDNDCKTADMSTRRRRSYGIQEMVVEELKKHSCFTGTSNPLFAMQHDVKPVGTVSHQWIMATQALLGIKHCNKYAMEHWHKTFGTNLGTILTDTVTLDVFLEDFDQIKSTLFSATRCDSGDEIKYTDKVVAHYKKMGIGPMHKTIIFSNSLNVEKAIKIRKYCEGKIKCSFGIGNHLANDFVNSPAVNMVIKLWSMNGIPVVKLSDDIGKVTGDSDAVRVTKWSCLGTPLDQKQ